MKLKKLSWWFIILEGLDILTTYIGVYVFGAVEKNTLFGPLPYLIIYKILATIIAVIIIQKKPFEETKDWRVKTLVGIALAIPAYSVIWNTIILGLLTLITYRII
jgi:hypothetical protein